MVIIEIYRTEVYFNKHLYAGFDILNLTKILTYAFRYNYVKRTFGDQAQLMYIDTDSLLYKFNVTDIYDYIKRDLTRFDTFDYSPDNVYGIPLVNKKVLDLVEDENNGKIMTKFVGLRAKLYAFKTLGEDKDKKKANGIKGADLVRILKKSIFLHFLHGENSRDIRSRNITVMLYLGAW